MEFVKVKLTKSWGENDYYKAGNVVYVSTDVAKMMTEGPNKYGHLIDNDNDKILDEYFLSKDEEE